MPVGIWVRDTDELVLLIACPPGPRPGEIQKVFFKLSKNASGYTREKYDQPLTNRSSNSFSGISTFRCLDRIRFSFLMEPGNLGLMGSSFTSCAQN